MVKRLGWLYPNWFHLWMRQRERQVALHADHRGQLLQLRQPQVALQSQCCGRRPPWSTINKWNLDRALPAKPISFFPRASERRVLPIVGVCLSSSHLHIFISSSHLLIFTSSHPHIFTPSHLLIFTSSHLHIFLSSHIFTSSHPLIFTSSHLHIFSSSHLLIFTSSHLHIFSSSHLLIFTSSHLHICSSSHLLILTSSHLHILTSSHLLLLPSCPHIFTSSPLVLLPSCPLLLFYFSCEGGGRGSANETARNATLSHEMRFDRQKLM